MTTYFLRSSGGSDGNAGTSFGAAWATFDYAIGQLVAGDRLLVCADGTHSPTSETEITVGGSLAAGRITVTGAASDGTDDGTVATISGASLPANKCIVTTSGASGDMWHFANLIFDGGRDCCVEQNAGITGWSFYNCTFANANNEGLYLGSGQALLVGCEAYGNGTIGFGGSGNQIAGEVTYINCSAHDNGTHGFASGKHACHYIDCLSYDNGGEGINANYFQDGQVVYGCTVFGNTGDGFASDGTLASFNARPSAFLNNVFSDNGAYGVSLQSGYEAAFLGDGLVDFNLFNQNTSGHRSNISTDYSSASPSDGTDPGFTSETDGSENFKPSSSSSAVVDAGTPIKTA